FKCLLSRKPASEQVSFDNLGIPVIAVFFFCDFVTNEIVKTTNTQASASRVIIGKIVGGDAEVRAIVEHSDSRNIYFAHIVDTIDICAIVL
ncbi:MAG TPA: hypothetical protein VM577_21380, partial [Anaerovoracaceae bacterium]|nr:hypothetical protein [Anaerovoracaceae bacterium]